MIIVLEGADGTGKTTLAKKLKDKYKAYYIHATWSRELNPRMLEYHMQILSEAYEWIKNYNRPVIIDRLWLSEAIYSEVFRDGSKYPWEARIMDQFIKSIGGLNIICLAGKDHEKRFQNLKNKRLEMYDNIEKVVNHYNIFWNGDAVLSKYMNKGYLREIVATGGVKNKSNYINYVIEIHGNDLTTYIQNIGNILKDIKI